MIIHDFASLSRQQLLPLTGRDLGLVRWLDEFHLELPFYGARKLTWELDKERHQAGRRHANADAQYGYLGVLPQVAHQHLGPGAAIRPYLLGNLTINLAH